MTRSVAMVAAVLLLLTFGTGRAELIEVPEDYPTINLAIQNAAVSGCTVSVWGPPPGGPPEPPYTYYENIDFQGKSLAVASRCFLPGETPVPDSE